MAAWVRDGVIYARERRPNGRLGRRVRVARDASAGQPSVAVAANGRAAIAWKSQEPSGEVAPTTAARACASSCETPANHLASRSCSSATPTRARADGSRPNLSRADALPNGSIALVWVGEERDKTVIRAARTTDARIGPTQSLSDPTRDAAGPQVAVGIGGDTAVGWSDLDDQAATVDLEAALQPAGATAFGPREQIAPGRPFAGGVAVAIDPVGGRVVAAWEERSGVSSPRHARLRASRAGASPAPLRSPRARGASRRSRRRSAR